MTTIKVNTLFKITEKKIDMEKIENKEEKPYCTVCKGWCKYWYVQPITKEN